MWFRVDDGFNQHPKVLSIRRSRRSDALALWFQTGVWCASHTDGDVPSYLPDEYDRADFAQDLVDAGLWEIAEAGWLFHDWLDYNPPKVDEATRAAKVAAGRKGAAKRWGARPPVEQMNGTSLAAPELVDASISAGEWHDDGRAMAADSRGMAEPWQSDGPGPVPGPVPEPGTRDTRSKDQTPRGRARERTPIEPALVAVPDRTPLQPTPRRFSPDFDDFWQAYPNQYQAPNAWRAWNHALNRATPEVILTAARRYRDDPHRPFGYEPAPAKWLTEDGWLNGPCPSRQPQPKRAASVDAVDALDAQLARISQEEADANRNQYPQTNHHNQRQLGAAR